MSDVKTTPNDATLVQVADAEAEPTASRDQTLVIGRILLDMRHARSLYFDDHAATDGGFSILLDMYLDTARGRRTPIARVVAATDESLSTALYVLHILVDAGLVNQVGGKGEEYYVLTANAERSMHRYLSYSIDIARRAGAIEG